MCKLCTYRTHRRERKRKRSGTSNKCCFLYYTKMSTRPRGDPTSEGAPRERWMTNSKETSLFARFVFVSSEVVSIEAPLYKNIHHM